MSRSQPTAATNPGLTRRRGRPALGRAEPLELTEILARARQITRAESLDALSMRRLAKDLGVTPMSIYHHVADKPALMQALIDQVWAEIVGGATELSSDPLEFVIALCIRTRDLWLADVELANLAVAVAAADEAFFQTTLFQTAVFEAAGFPDVPLAYSAVQNFTMGSILTYANRRSASAYFGRDPRTILAKARRLLTKRNATSNHRGLLDARFDIGDNRHFDPALRCLVAGLLAATTPPATDE